MEKRLSAIYSINPTHVGMNRILPPFALSTRD